MTGQSKGDSVTEAQPELLKVLIVDDSRMVRASIIKHIRGRFECREESDGEAAWQALVVDPSIELLISDIGMPRLDGYGLVERVRGSKLARLQHLPIVIISGDEDDAARERARQLGANDFITKGIGTAELLARLDSLTRLAQTRRELEESRAALANQSALDPSSGLATRSYLNFRGSQGLSHARRDQGGISAIVIEIDHFDSLSSWHGPGVAQLVAKKLSRILSSKIRHEDTVAELAPGQFAVLSPVSDMVACCAFALRLQSAIEKLILTYRQERIRISFTAGVASSAVDGITTVSHLLGIAVCRLEAGQKAGGNRVVGDEGEVSREVMERMLRHVVSIDQMLTRIKLGHGEDVSERLPEVISTLLPLLELIESKLALGMPLDRLKEQRAASDQESAWQNPMRER